MIYRKHPKWLALDTETTGLDLWHGCKPFMVTTCDEDETRTCWEWPVDPKTRNPVIPSKDIKAIQTLIDDHSLIFHNAKFDIRGLETIGVKIRKHHWTNLQDTLIGSHCLYSGQPHGLKQQALLHLDIEDDDQTDLQTAVKDARKIAAGMGWRIAQKGDPHWPGLDRKEFWGFDYWLPAAIAAARNFKPDHPWRTLCRKYALCDAERTIALWLYYGKLLKERDLETQYRKRCGLIRVTYLMEERGVSYDRSRLLKTIDYHRRRITESESACRRFASIDNLNSSPQLQRCLFGELGLTPVRQTKTGWSTDADTIDHLLDTTPKQSKAHHFLRHFKNRADSDTIYGYLTKYRDFSAGSDRINPSVNVTGTHTTRFSMERPNGQNVDRRQRKIFRPRKGRKWLKADYANIELRILSWAAEEEELIQAFLRGESVHMNFARIICPQLIKKAGSDDAFKETDEYHWVKNGDFALTYGAGRETADATYKIPGAYDKVMAYFHNLKGYTRAMISQAYRTHRVTCLGGYQLDIPYGREPTTAVDYYCQGSAGWIITEAMLNCQYYLDDWNATHKPEDWAYIILQIHDELVFDLPESFPERTIKNLFTLMECPGDSYGVPTPVEAKIIPASSDWSAGTTVWKNGTWIGGTAG